ncbi:MAG: DUF3892 domain-containing protein [Candidatus Promineifilaceae bacterium]
MVDHTRIATGYDVELLLGGDYFLTIFQGAYDAGLIEPVVTTEQVVVTSDDPTIERTAHFVIQVDKPNGLTILGDEPEADMQIAVPITPVRVQTDTNLNNPDEVVVTEEPQDPVTLPIRLNADFSATELAVSFHSLEPLFRTLMVAQLGEEQVVKIEATLTDRLAKQFPLSLTAEGAVEIVPLKVSRSGTDAIGFYINLDLRVAPQSGPPESEFVARGDVNAAASFLPADKAFAFGFSPATFNRLANHLWHTKLSVVRADGTIAQPVFDPQTNEEIGRYESLSIKPLSSGVIEVTILSRIFLPVWPDATVKAVFHLKTTVQAGRLRFNLELVDFNVNTRLIGDLLAFLIAGALGALVAFLFSAPGLVILIVAGASGSGGVITLEVIEEIKENSAEEDAEAEAQKINAAALLSSLPTHLKLFDDARDPLFVREYFIVNQFDGVQIDSQGMSFVGEAVIATQNRTLPVTLVGRERGNGDGSWHGLRSLTYRLDSGQDITLALPELLTRIARKELRSHLRLHPTHIRRKKGVVKEMLFDTGVDFLVSEMANLQMNAIAGVFGYQFIRPRKGNPYFRAEADESATNNLESLPSF